MSHFITGRKYVHFIYWSKKCPSIICPSKICPSKKRPGAGKYVQQNVPMTRLEPGACGIGSDSTAKEGNLPRQLQTPSMWLLRNFTYCKNAWNAVISRSYLSLWIRWASTWGRKKRSRPWLRRRFRCSPSSRWRQHLHRQMKVGSRNDSQWKQGKTIC